jgi:hypothetical protein
MPRTTDLIRKSVLRDVPSRVPDLNELRASQRCRAFERLCSNRMVMGAMRYGLLKDNSGGKFDSIGSIIARAEKFRRDGNVEHLCDIANLAMVEFTKQNRAVQSVDDGDHVQEV